MSPLQPFFFVIIISYASSTPWFVLARIIYLSLTLKRDKRYHWRAYLFPWKSSPWTHWNDASSRTRNGRLTNCSSFVVAAIWVLSSNHRTFSSACDHLSCLAAVWAYCTWRWKVEKLLSVQAADSYNLSAIVEIQAARAVVAGEC